MATENLKVKITADASQAKAEIGKFKESLKSTVSAADSATGAANRLKGALAALAAVKVAKAMIQNAVSVAAAGDAIKDNAQKVFMSTTAYQEWGYVLKQNGIEIASLKTGMRQFAQQVANGSDALAKYGITSRNIDTAFQQAISTIQNMTSETEKVAAATELFGSRALELMPILNLTNAETQSLMDTYRAVGGTMSNELIAASDICTDSITEMKAAWGGLRNLLAAYVIPVISKVVQWITLAIGYIRILLSAILGVKETFGGGGKKSIAGTSASVAKNTGGTAKNLGKAAKKAKELKRTMMGIDELSRLAEQATAAAAGGGGGGGSIGGGVGGIDMGAIEEASSLFSSETLEKLNAFREKIESISGILNGMYLILKGLVEISLGKWADGWTDIQNGVKKVWENLKEMFPWLEKVEALWNNLKGKTVELKATLSDKFSAAWASIKGKWDDVKSKTATVTAQLSDKFTSAWNKIKGLWNGLKNKTVSIGISFKNSLSSKWNSLAKKVNSARQKYAFVKTILPQFPLLAKGGILTAPTTAVLGEYAGARSNPEIATPQSLMYETIQKANGDMVSAFATMTRQIIAAIETKDLSVNIGDEQVARSAQRGNTAYYNRTGRALLTI